MPLRRGRRVAPQSVEESAPCGPPLARSGVLRARHRSSGDPTAGGGHEGLAQIESRGKRSSFGRSGRYGRVTVCRVVVPVIHLAYPPGLMVADDGLKKRSPILTTTESPAPAVTTIVPVMLLWWRQR